MYMKNTFLLLSWLILLPSGILANPIKEMLERIDKGASDKFVVELHKSSNDFFELDQKGDKVCLLYTSPSPRDKRQSRMPSSA